MTDEDDTTITDPIAGLFDEAEGLKEQAERLGQRKRDNRDALRVMERAGALTTEQVGTLNTYYPPRKTRGTKED